MVDGSREKEEGGPGGSTSRNSGLASGRGRALRVAGAKSNYAEDAGEEIWEEELYNDSEAMEVDEQAPNDECEVCGRDDDDANALVCDKCPRVFHLYCLDPPLSKVPKGDWLCPHCLLLDKLGRVERVLARRERRVPPPAVAAAPGLAKDKEQGVAEVADLQQDDEKKKESSAVQTVAAEEEAAAAKGKDVDQQQHSGSVIEYRLKFKGYSYLHSKWVGLETLKEAGRRFPGLLRKLANFDARSRATGGAGDEGYEMDSGDEGQEGGGELVDGVLPDWLVVERVVAGRRRAAAQGGGGKEYLVKWKGLGYDESTWEDEALLGAYPKELQRFSSQRAIAEQAAAESRRTSHGRAGPSTGGGGGGAAGGGYGAATASNPRRFAETPAFLSGGELHPYQLEGVNWLLNAWQVGKHVMLADEMGLGKTVQSVSFVAALKECEHVSRPSLVVVPLSTIRNWEREFALWAPQLNVVTFVGNQAARDVIKQHELFAPPASSAAAAAAAGVSPTSGRASRMSQSAGGSGVQAAAGGVGQAAAAGGGGGGGGSSRRAELQARIKFDVLLTSYEMLLVEGSDLRKLEYETMIVDEAHRLKNKQSRLFQELADFNVGRRLLLTGTPLQNNLGELFMLMHFLDATKFCSLEDFEREFADIGHEQQVAKLHEVLSPHVLRRVKKDVLTQLPPKKEQIVRVELARTQKEYYKSILTRSFPVLAAGKATTAAAPRLKNVVMELRKCCNHLYLFDGAEDALAAAGGAGPQAALQRLVDCSGKLALVDKMMVRLKERGHRVLLYSQFTRMLDILEDWLAARGWGYCRIDGSVAGAERQQRIDRFNRQPGSYFCFLLSTRAGGLGINLATADTVIIFDSDWNPHNDLQAQARAHRLGQQKSVMIYRLVCRATVEERMMQTSKRKLLLEHVVVEKMRNQADLKQHELDDLLRYGAAELFADEAQQQQVALPDGQGAGQVQQQQQEAERQQELGGAGAESRSGAQPGDAAAGAAAAAAAGAAAPVVISALAREQAEGRTGGDTGKRIVYDDAAIERLLDRSSMISEGGGAGGEADEDDTGGGDFMRAFKVANFEVTEEEEQEEAKQQQDEDCGAAEGDTNGDAADGSGAEQAGGGMAAFWSGLLGSRYEAVREMEMALMGKGKRERRQVYYAENGAVLPELGDDGDDASADAEDDDEFDKPRRKRRRFTYEERAMVEERRLAKVARVAEAAGAPPPLMSGEGQTLKVLGFTRKQRQGFIKALMRYGIRQSGPNEYDWAHYQSYLPNKPVEAINRYGEKVMELLKSAADAPDKGGTAVAAATASGAGMAGGGIVNEGLFPGGVPRAEVLFDHQLQAVLVRVGFVHLITIKVADCAGLPVEKFTVGTPRFASRLLGSTRGSWKPRHDWHLLMGVLKHGYGRWNRILEDPEYKLEDVVRAELGFAPKASLPAGPSAAATATAGPAPATNSLPGSPPGSFSQQLQQAGDGTAVAAAEAANAVVTKQEPKQEPEPPPQQHQEAGAPPAVADAAAAVVAEPAAAVVVAEPAAAVPTVALEEQPATKPEPEATPTGMAVTVVKSPATVALVAAGKPVAAGGRRTESSGSRPEQVGSGTQRQPNGDSSLQPMQVDGPAGDGAAAVAAADGDDAAAAAMPNKEAASAAAMDGIGEADAVAAAAAAGTEKEEEEEDGGEATSPPQGLAAEDPFDSVVVVAPNGSAAVPGAPVVYGAAKESNWRFRSSDWIRKRIQLLSDALHAEYCGEPDEDEAGAQQVGAGNNGNQACGSRGKEPTPEATTATTTATVAAAGANRPAVPHVHARQLPPSSSSAAAAAAAAVVGSNAGSVIGQYQGQTIPPRKALEGMDMHHQVLMRLVDTVRQEAAITHRTVSSTRLPVQHVLHAAGLQFRRRMGEVEDQVSHMLACLRMGFGAAAAMPQQQQQQASGVAAPAGPDQQALAVVSQQQQQVAPKAAVAHPATPSQQAAAATSLPGMVHQAATWQGAARPPAPQSQPGLAWGHAQGVRPPPPFRPAPSPQLPQQQQQQQRFAAAAATQAGGSPALQPHAHAHQQQHYPPTSAGLLPPHLLQQLQALRGGQAGPTTAYAQQQQQQQPKNAATALATALAHPLLSHPLMQQLVLMVSTGRDPLTAMREIVAQNRPPHEQQATSASAAAGGSGGGAVARDIAGVWPLARAASGGGQQQQPPRALLPTAGTTQPQAPGGGAVPEGASVATATARVMPVAAGTAASALPPQVVVQPLVHNTSSQSLSSALAAGTGPDGIGAATQMAAAAGEAAGEGSKDQPIIIDVDAEPQQQGGGG